MIHDKRECVVYTCIYITYGQYSSSTAPKRDYTGQLPTRCIYTSIKKAITSKKDRLEIRSEMIISEACANTPVSYLYGREYNQIFVSEFKWMLHYRPVLIVLFLLHTRYLVPRKVTPSPRRSFEAGFLGTWEGGCKHANPCIWGSFSTSTSKVTVFFVVEI